MCATYRPDENRNFCYLNNNSRQNNYLFEPAGTACDRVL